jgi:hypothetical protein
LIHGQRLFRAKQPSEKAIITTRSLLKDWDSYQGVALAMPQDLRNQSPLTKPLTTKGTKYHEGFWFKGVLPWCTLVALVVAISQIAPLLKAPSLHFLSLPLPLRFSDLSFSGR